MNNVYQLCDSAWLLLSESSHSDTLFHERRLHCSLLADEGLDVVLERSLADTRAEVDSHNLALAARHRATGERGTLSVSHKLFKKAIDGIINPPSAIP
jgi:uncharacterized protein YprB with RNaseH-like and TPR domain